MSEDVDEQAFLRLPIRRIEATPEVAARLRGGVPDSSPGSVIPGGRPGVDGFPWARPKGSNSGGQLSAEAAESPEHRSDDGEHIDDVKQPDADSPAAPDRHSDDTPTDNPGSGAIATVSPADDADLTDWQRQWLASDTEGDGEADETPSPAEPGGWWEGIPAIRQLLLDGLDLGPATVFVGENGSGKSTLVEALATVYGISSAGGSTGSVHRTPLDESQLAEQLHLIRGGSKGRSGYFLRAETMHGFFTYLAENPRPSNVPPDYDFLEMSHGESFVTLVEDRFRTYRPGLYILDEPESALSFDNQLRLLRHLQMLMATGRHQIVMATHSPILAALPGATLYELDDRGFREVDHDDATLVRNWRHFMNDPSAFLDSH